MNIAEAVPYPHPPNPFSLTHYFPPSNTHPKPSHAVLDILLFCAAATLIATQFKCGTAPPSPEQALIDLNLSILEQEAASPATAGSSPHHPHPHGFNINVHWHVIALNNTQAGGTVSAAHLDAQLVALNEAYAPHSISFTQASSQTLVQPHWARHKGKGELPVPVIGYALVPLELADRSRPVNKEDGVVTFSKVIFGEKDYHQVWTALTHEVGHWLGCDMVDDTPAHTSTGGNCEVQNSCPNLPGLDPVSNYMSYAPDKCKTKFTFGQEGRMHTIWHLYRAKK
ncbi:hypothetical protein EJ02DRAFT_433583 [Clathrospora elynae]|uniref:Peptidase M43 pregnancy-associated plasma-A domain-containing protein n=1 Tax=Clathrospora elynae TaxID=706981 RepID=A0A6A5SQM1_9PLEO|nr:hypothetical protein EJ02DRAFT_433583 [Clathrospora elynae]